jgi:hypothetical protein
MKRSVTVWLVLAVGAVLLIVLTLSRCTGTSKPLKPSGYNPGGPRIPASASPSP